MADVWWSAPGTRPADGWTYLLASVSLLVLWWRLRWSGSAVVVCGVAWTALAWRGHHGELLFLPSAVALYTVAAGGDRRRSLVWGALAVGCCGVVAWVAGGRVSAPVTEMLWPLAAVALGEAARSRRELSAEYAARQVRADAEQRSRAGQRVQQERLRIAVQELRAAVVLLREAGPDAPAPPSPGLAQLDGLVERVRAVGVRVSV
jgi:hypothetical protein